MKEITQLSNFTKKCIFIDAGHKYIELETGNLLTSVTTVTSTFQDKFDKKYWSAYKALQRSGYQVYNHNSKSKKIKKGKIGVKRGSKVYRYTPDEIHEGKLELTVKPEEILKEWDYKGLIARERGTILHNYLEDKWRGKVYKINSDWKSLIKPEDHNKFKKDVETLIGQGNEFINDHNYLVPTSLEQIVYDEEFQVAGQIDALLYDPNLKRHYIFDYKTDKEIAFSNKWQRFKGVLHDLEDCNYNKYSLQLSMYKELLQRNTDINISAMFVVWFNVNNKSYKVIRIKDQNDAVKQMLNVNRNIHC